MPHVPLAGRLHRGLNITSEDLRFYHSVFPLCDGLGSDAWSYDVHPASSFRLNADFDQEYVLHIDAGNGDKRQVQIYFKPECSFEMIKTHFTDGFQL